MFGKTGAGKNISKADTPTSFPGQGKTVEL